MGQEGGDGARVRLGSGLRQGEDGAWQWTGRRMTWWSRWARGRRGLEAGGADSALGGLKKDLVVKVEGWGQEGGRGEAGSRVREGQWVGTRGGGGLAVDRQERPGGQGGVRVEGWGLGQWGGLALRRQRDGLMAKVGKGEAQKGISPPADFQHAHNQHPRIVPHDLHRSPPASAPRLSLRTRSCTCWPPPPAACWTTSTSSTLWTSPRQPGRRSTRCCRWDRGETEAFDTEGSYQHPQGIN